MTIKTYHSDIFRMIQIPGEFDLEDSRSFIQAIQTFLSENNKPILINCQAAEIMQSQCLGAIVQGYKLSRDKRAYFGVLNPSTKFSYLLETTGLDQIFNIIPSFLELNTKEWEKVVGLNSSEEHPFSFTVKHDETGNILSCHNIMEEGKEFNSLIYHIEESQHITLDCHELAFISLSCMKRIKQSSHLNHITLIGGNSIIEEEFIAFQMMDKVKSFNQSFSKEIAA